MHWTFTKWVALLEDLLYDDRILVKVCHFLSELREPRELSITISAEGIRLYGLMQKLSNPLYEIHPSSKYLVSFPGVEDRHGELRASFRIIPGKHDWVGTLRPHFCR